MRLLYECEKDMVCILKPGFFLRGGIPYGPMFNDLVVVEAVYQWDAYPEQRYVQLQGWRYPSPAGSAFQPFLLYRLVHFAEVMPNEALEELMESEPLLADSPLSHAGRSIVR